MKYCTVHGRFQPLHLGHLLGHLLPAKEKCDHLIIGITNPDPTLTLPDDTNISRTSRHNNPLTYFERVKIIESVLVDVGISRSQFTIVPFPINYPQVVKYYVPEEAVHCLTIFDEWGEKKLRSLKYHGLKTHVLFRKDINEKVISSTLVREKIIRGSKIDNLVPKQVIDYIDDYDLKNRLINLRNQAI